ncbi:DNA repair protein RadC [Paraburkholderia sp. MMS20-SJTR3]|uniref:DNA repair protein RadC n=1 Tax=Paraburkholderia sejongensis TaxID=2886946 RepID=A0ABS8JWC7_9BURK|nr:DNA repair protein RadC [Paraburkholderia sp. MMS20-SJTR3]MCC8394202.1 DNA repair protein RadC [Paraburkholderia sp. MMS20-SJTR3]
MADFASPIDATAEAGTRRPARRRGKGAPGGQAAEPTDGAAARIRSRLLRGKWHRSDMPRERLISKGPSALSDTEMIALVLGSGLPGHDVFRVAGALLERFGTLRAMLDATYTDFDGIRGLGPAKKTQLLAIMEMSRRSLVDRMRRRELLNSPETVENYLRLLIGGRPLEVFVSLFLDARHRLIDCEESAQGSLTRMAVYPREIVRRALAANAASLIVAHNHPSGALQPSASDCRLTQTLRDALALVDIQLIDHLVVSADGVYSFARAGWPKHPHRPAAPRQAEEPLRNAVSGVANKV